jgi:malonate decarboxylase gamma subunit
MAEAASDHVSTRGRIWHERLAQGGTPVTGLAASVLAADLRLGDREARIITVVPDPDTRFPRAARGEFGLLEGWNVAKAVTEVVEADRAAQVKRALVALVDIPSQAYGRREEAFGLHQSLAAAGGAYASARLAGHPVVALIVGKAMSGGFLAHGYQANRIIALDDPGVVVHAMNRAAAARITLRSVADLEVLAAKVPPMAYDVKAFDSLGILWRLIQVGDAEDPSGPDLALARQTLLEALEDLDGAPRDLSGRLGAPNRAASAAVRARLREQWQ